MTALTLAPLFKRKHSGSHNMSWRKIPKLPTRLSKRRNSSSETIDVVTAPAPSFSLADLPGELVRGIVSYLDYAEVRTLRLVCRDFNELVTAPNCEVMRHLVNHQLKHIPRPIAQPAACEADWDRILQRTRRWDFAEALSAELLLYVQYKIPIHHNVQRVLRFPPQAKNIQAKMTPLLFTLSEYLSTCQSHLMEMASEDDVSLECQARLDAHTVALLETTPSDQIQDLHGMWLFLMGVLNFVLARPSYAGTVERTLRGWTADPLDRCSLARVLVFGNVPAILKILSLGHYAERKKWARQHLKSLDPDHGPEWSDSWAKGDVGFNGDIPRAQAAKATKLDILMHCLWTQGAKLVLDKTGHSLSEDELKPTNANTITFLSKLAGCDTLTTPISAFNEHSVNNDHSRTNGADDNQTRSTFSSLEFTEMVNYGGTR